MKALLRGMAEATLPRDLLVLRGAGAERRVALTFDDGPEPSWERYLDVLSRAGARATFFLLGENLDLRREAAVEMVRRGHEVASHGWSHKTFPKMRPRELDFELDRTSELLPPARTRRTLLRPPQGVWNTPSLLRCRLRGYTTVLWSLDSDDCRTQDPRAVVARCAPDHVRSGEIVLLHEGQDWTLEALPDILQALSQAGFRLVTASEVIDGA